MNNIDGKQYRTIYVVVPSSLAESVATIGYCLNEEPSWFDVERQAEDAAREAEAVGHYSFKVVRVLIEVS
jgi:hypothetical protein